MNILVWLNLYVLCVWASFKKRTLQEKGFRVINGSRENSDSFIFRSESLWKKKISFYTKYYKNYQINEVKQTDKGSSRVKPIDIFAPEHYSLFMM